MKSERRHEIQENSLARFLEAKLEQAKPHAPLIGGIALALVLAWIAVIVMSREGGPIENVEWNTVFNVLDESFRVGEDDVKAQEVAQQFGKIAEDHGDSSAALWAEYFFGQQNLTQASDVAFSDPSAATADIERALSSFQKVYDATDLPALKVKALWGMAEAYELRATEESLAKAKETYQEVVDVWPDTTTAQVAQDRIDRLNNPLIVGESGFYAWYREQDFASRAAEAARENRAPLEGGLPGMDADLEAPGGSLFDSPGAGTPGGTQPPASGSEPLFTPSMDLDDAAEATPQPSTFTEQEGASPTPSDQPTPREEPATPEESPMTEPMADPMAEPMPEMEQPMTEQPAPEQPAAEEPAEEPTAEQSPAVEPASEDAPMEETAAEDSE